MLWQNLNTKIIHLKVGTTRLQRIYLSTIFLVALIIVILGVLRYVEFLTMSDLSSAVAQLLVGAVFVVIFWGIGENIKRALGKRESATSDKAQPPKYIPMYRNLVLYYVRPRGLADTPENSQLRFLIYKPKNIAIFVREFPEWLLPAVKRHDFEWKGYDKESSLKHTLKDFAVNYGEISPEAIGLKYAEGGLIEDARYSDILSKIEKSRFEKLLIAKLSRRYFLKFKRRNLVVDFSNNKVWLAPPYWYQLEEIGAIASETYGMRCYESCKRWAKRKFGFEYVPNYYPESQLITKATSKQS